MTQTNVTEVATIYVDGVGYIEVSLSVEERERGLSPFVFASIEFCDDDGVWQTLSISEAEALYEALGDAIETAKKAIEDWLADESPEPPVRNGERNG